MHNRIVHLLLALFFLAVPIYARALSNADIPSESRRQSPDGTCGGINKYTCDGSDFGRCCSIAGWCGNTTAYCLAAHGCRAGFGECIDGVPSPNMTTPSLDGMCGGKVSCAGGPWDGACCSSAGYCGYSDDYCSTVKGCQSGLGDCKQVSLDGTCGGSTGFTCVGSRYGVCCSEAGWCGSDTLHCGSRCQGKVGPCLAPTADGSCSIERGYTCLGSSFGECCSSTGFCGNTTQYCSTFLGCNTGAFNNPDLGTCLTP